MSATYLDSSALVKLIVVEPESHALRQYLATAGPLASSILATVEVARAVARVAPESAAATAAAISAAFESVSVIGFDSRVASRAAALAPIELRTLDAIHLATALELGAELTAFVSYDARLSAAALAAGLPVVAPAGAP